MAENALNYCGKIDEECIVEFVDLLNHVLVKSLGQRKDLRKICSFALELLDNGMRYSLDELITFSWTLDSDIITFELENKAQMVDAFRLKKQADLIRSLSIEEIKAAFHKQIIDTSFGAKGGAGLGLLQMLRKGALSIEVNILQVESSENFVCNSRIQTSITTQKAS
jgi:hypothetical protein